MRIHIKVGMRFNLFWSSYFHLAPYQMSGVFFQSGMLPRQRRILTPPIKVPFSIRRFSRWSQGNPGRWTTLYELHVPGVFFLYVCFKGMFGRGPCNSFPCISVFVTSGFGFDFCSKTGPISGKRMQVRSNQADVPHVKLSYEKNPRILSIESWLVYRDPYIGLLRSP